MYPSRKSAAIVLSCVQEKVDRKVFFVCERVEKSADFFEQLVCTRL